MLRKRMKGLVMGLLVSSVAIVPTMAVENTVPVTLDAEPMVLDVTVPVSMPINVDNRGNVTAATNSKIVNNSRGAVVVNDVNVLTKDGWNLVDFDKDFSASRVGTREIGFKINNVKSTDAGFTWGQAPMIRGLQGVTVSDLGITYDAKVPAQQNAISNLTVADIIFTINWYE